MIKIYYRALLRAAVVFCFLLKIWTSAANQITAITDDAKISLEDSIAVVTEASLNRATARLVSVSGMKCNNFI